MATKRCQIGRNNPEMTGHRYLWQNTEIQNMASGWFSTHLANQRKQSTFNWQIRLRTWTWAKILRAGGWTAQVQPSTLPTDQPTISLPLHNQLLLKRIKQRERRIHLRTLMSSQELLLHGILREKNFQNLSSWADLHLLIGQCQGSELTPWLTVWLTPCLTPWLVVVSNLRTFKVCELVSPLSKWGSSYFVFYLENEMFSPHNLLYFVGFMQMTRWSGGCCGD